MSSSYKFTVYLYITACQSDFSQALFWNNSRRGVQVIQSCSELHSSFRFGVGISRQCQADGSWSPVDVRNCTMFRDSNPVIVVYFTTRQNNTVVPDDVSNMYMYCYNRACFAPNHIHSGKIYSILCYVRICGAILMHNVDFF